MKILLKIVAALFVACACFLLYAVVHAAASSGGANVAVCVGYVAGAALLAFLAVAMWRGRIRGTRTARPQAGV
jgi:threonine/homoserine/homoserine lactone efflux protein